MNELKVDVIIVVHGSRSISAYEEMWKTYKHIEELVIRENLNVNNLYLAFNGKKENIPIPDWREVINHVVESGSKNIVILPLFIFYGTHVEKDIVNYFGSNASVDRWFKTLLNNKEINLYIASTLSSSKLFELVILNKIFEALRKLNQLENNRTDSKTHSYEFCDIEIKSMEKILELVDKTYATLSKFSRRILAKVVFATGNPELMHYVYIHPEFENIAKEVFRFKTMPVVTDVKMVYVGIKWKTKFTFIDDEEVKKIAYEKKITRSAAAILEAAKRFNTFVPVIGNSPSALLQLLHLVENGYEIPLVIATPPGFMNAEYAKNKLIEFSIPCVTVRKSYGGSSIAVAIFNEVVKHVD